MLLLACPCTGMANRSHLLRLEKGRTELSGVRGSTSPQPVDLQISPVGGQHLWCASSSLVGTLESVVSRGRRLGGVHWEGAAIPALFGRANQKIMEKTALASNFQGHRGK